MHSNNRAFKFGDCLFETIKVINKKILLLDYHFDRLKKSMEFLEFDFPENFSEEFLANIIYNNLPDNLNYRVRINIFRDSGGLYIPHNNNVKFYFNYEELKNISYLEDLDNYTIGIYDKLKVHKSPISNLKTNNRIINVMAGLELKKRYYLNNILLLNDENNIVESFNSNIFFIKKDKIYTPKLTDGCINGIIRKYIIDNFKIEEISINEDILLNSEEIFLTNAVKGIILVKNFFKKKFRTGKSKEIADILCNKLLK